LDYALTQAARVQAPATPATTDLLMASMPAINADTEMPHFLDVILRFLFYTFLLGLCILSLVTLWLRAPIFAFAIFLVWTVAFYFLLMASSWHKRPNRSVLTVAISRLRGSTDVAPAPTARSLSTLGLDQYPFTSDSRGPYVHHPPYHRAGFSIGTDEVSTSHGGHPMAETDEDDDDDDEDARQRRIEEEIERRDVNIVTIPNKRKLRIANPS